MTLHSREVSLERPVEKPLFFICSADLCKSLRLSCFKQFHYHAKASGAWLVDVGALKLYGESVYCGSSFVLSPAGELVAAAPDFEEGFVSCEVGADVLVAKDAVLSPEVYDQINISFPLK